MTPDMFRLYLIKESMNGNIKAVKELRDLHWISIKLTFIIIYIAFGLFAYEMFIHF
ncbi:MAG: hypothetical protein AB8G05_15840 [Oligoflexales bacterium]